MLTNRPLSGQSARAAMVPAKRIRKLNTTINVQLVDGQEVFGRYEDRIASQPPSPDLAPPARPVRLMHSRDAADTKEEWSAPRLLSSSWRGGPLLGRSGSVTAVVR